MQNPSSAMLVRAGMRVRIIGFPRIGSLGERATTSLQPKQTQAHREERLPNRGKSPFHAQSYRSQCATVPRIGAPYLQTSRKRMHRPNDRYSVDGDTAATLLGARIYFRSQWYRAIGVA